MSWLGLPFHCEAEAAAFPEFAWIRCRISRGRQVFEFARADKKQRPSEEGKHTGYRSDEKLKNDVLLVALRSPKNSKPKAAEPEVMKSELYLYLFETFGWSKQHDTDSLDNSWTRAGTWLQRPRVISVMNAALFVGKSAADMRLLPCYLYVRKTACYSGLHTHTHTLEHPEGRDMRWDE